MFGNQKTISSPCSLTGTGLHTGAQVTVTLKPAPANHGIVFIRIDLPQKPLIKVGPDSIVSDPSVSRCTAVQNEQVQIYTVEHLMSVLYGLGIDNLLIEIDGPELPGLDGSGLDFLNAVKKAGVAELAAPKKYFEIKEPIGVANNGSSIFIVPAKEFKVSYMLQYEHPLLRSQFVSTTVDGPTFEKELAPSRTFCLESEAKELRARGLGKGANYQNTLVVGEKGVIENVLRFPDEFARHKILDCIGDLYLFGMPVLGHVYAIKSGHVLNRQLVQKIAQQQNRYEKRGFLPQPLEVQGTEIGIHDIMKILPHRYPFLLVDKVYEIEKGKKAVGIKNVTINDDFFQGHFPTRPIMPGVLMVEAMAQTAGVVVLRNEEHQGKVALFMAVDKVKFRKLVVPGDQLVMEVEVVRDRSRIAQIKGVSKVNGEIVAEAEMVFSFTEATILNPALDP